MKELFFDTETTGLYQRRLPPGHEDQPEIIQLCAILRNEGKILTKATVYVHGDRPIPEEAFQAHRISREVTEASGISRRTMCHLFAELVARADIIIGHNVEFDVNMMISSMLKEGGSGNIVRNATKFCTMKSSTNLCKIPHPNPRSPGDLKWPNLQEAYTTLVDSRGFQNAHDAEADVLACMAVYDVIRSTSN